MHGTRVPNQHFTANLTLTTKCGVHTCVATTYCGALCDAQNALAKMIKSSIPVLPVKARPFADAASVLHAAFASLLTRR